MKAKVWDLSTFKGPFITRKHKVVTAKPIESALFGPGFWVRVSCEECGSGFEFHTDKNRGDSVFSSCILCTKKNAIEKLGYKEKKKEGKR